MMRASALVRATDLTKMNLKVLPSIRGRLAPLVVAMLLALPAAAIAAPAHAPATAAHARTTSFHFANIPVRSALQLIAEEGGFNLVVSDAVQGNITLRLTDVTWEQALEIVLRMKGLSHRIDGPSTMTVTGG
jgi:type II secretory pathway component HofQ